MIGQKILQLKMSGLHFYDCETFLFPKGKTLIGLCEILSDYNGKKVARHKYLFTPHNANEHVIDVDYQDAYHDGKLTIYWLSMEAKEKIGERINEIKQSLGGAVTEE